MYRKCRYWVTLALTFCVASILVFSALKTFSHVRAFSEEGTELKPLAYFDPLDATPLASRTTYTPGVSSVHFDLVGAMAIAAGFSVTDAATIQAYSQGTDSGNLPGANPVYVFDADPSKYPVAPPISSVMTSTFCPSPSTTAPTVTLGTTALMTESGNTIGVFTSRFGPYGIFFHEPHERPDELGAIHDWAFGVTDALTGVVTFGYSSTVTSLWPKVYEAKAIGNIYVSTACFVSETVRIDTGSMQPGSLPALGVYLHSLGDSWSHRDCIAAADAAGLPFAAHVYTEGIRFDDPLYPCRWTDHKAEFGPPNAFPESNRTYTATLELYKALVDFSRRSQRAAYRPIGLTDENNHIANALYDFAHNTGTALNISHEPTRRTLADDLRTWALETRASKSIYWKQRIYLPDVSR